MLKASFYKLSLLIIFLVAGTANLLAASAASSIMNSVVRISGRSKKSAPVMGTGFLVQRTTSNHRQAWLVTASHVFKMISGDTIDLLLRQKTANGVAQRTESFKIRLSGNPLYKTHSRFDLAALLIELPETADYSLLSMETLAEEKDFSRLDLGIGNRLLIYGFPYGESFRDTGYCIVRNGIISSFPLLPVAKYSSYLADFEVFEGYSGSPVIVDLARTTMVSGMALEEVFLEELRPGKTKTLRKRHGLGLAKILNSAIIKEFIAGLR